MVLYIHIPFCESKCGYCAFSSVVAGQDFASQKKRYIDALICDISHSLQTYRVSGDFAKNASNDKNAEKLKNLTSTKNTPKLTLDSIYIGGGTPNTLDERDYERIFGAIFDNATITKDAQITIEANPNCLSKNWCEALRSFGVNRISMGVQSFESDKLRFLSRSHTQKDIVKALELASGFKYSSIDLIYGTPLDSSAVLKREVAKAVSLPILHISAYCLMYEQGAKNANKYAKLESKMRGEVRSFDDSRDLDFSSAKISSSDMSKIVCEELEKSGFSQYEVSSFCKDSHSKSLHNLSYWRGEEYLACGVSAVGRIGQCRYSGAKELDRYIAYPLQKECEDLSVEDLAFERVFLGLRSEVGVALGEQILRDLSSHFSTYGIEVLKSTTKPSKICDKDFTIKDCAKSLSDLERNITNALNHLINPARVAILLRERKCTLRGNILHSKDFFLADEIALYITSH